MADVSTAQLPEVLTNGVQMPHTQGKFCSWFGKCSASLGCWTRRNAKMLTCLLFGLLMIYLFMVLIAVEIEENEILAESAIASYITSAYHWRCKGTGCGGKCPHSDKSDPRVFVSEQTDYISTLLDLSRQHLTNEVQSNALHMAKYDDAEYKNKLSQMINNESNAVDSIFKLQLAARLIDKEYSNCDINSGTYTAQNHLVALSNAADANKAIMIVSTLARIGTVYKYMIDEEAKKDKSDIPKFDKDHDKWLKAAVALNQMVDVANSFASDTSEFSASQVALLDSVNNKLALKGEAIMNEVIKLAKVKDVMSQAVDNAVRQYRDLDHFREQYEKKYQKEPFNNDMPGQVSADAATSLIESGDYNQVMLKTALEPSVLENHKIYASKRQENGSVDVNQLSVRDDPNDVIPWVAYSRPTYTKSDGVTPADVPNKVITLTSIPSDNTDALRARPLKMF